MKAFGLPPSRKIGDVKRLLEQAALDGDVPTHQDADTYIEYLRTNAERFGL